MFIGNYLALMLTILGSTGNKYLLSNNSCVYKVADIITSFSGLFKP